MPNNDELIPREIEREWHGAFAILGAIGCSLLAIAYDWPVVVVLIIVLVWQVARAVRVTRKHG